MKWLGGIGVVLGLVGCGDDRAASTPDAGIDAGPADAPAVEPSCPGSKRFTLVDATPTAAASDGTTLYIAQTTMAGTGQLVAIPLSGGTPAVVATATSGTFAVTANGAAVFYVASLANGHEVHQRVGSVDTLVATLALQGDVAIAANATDVYLADTQKVVSVSRSGASTQTPTMVANTTGSPRELVAGATTVSWRQGTGFLGTPTIVPIAPLGEAVSLDSGVVHVGGDTAFKYDVRMETSRAHMDMLSTVYPAAEDLWSSQLYLTSNTFVGADARRLYFVQASATMSPSGQISAYTASFGAWTLNDAQHPAGVIPLCNYDPFAAMEQAGSFTYARQDEHYVYAFDANSVLAIQKL